jgi:hypothetical protein
VSEKRPPSEGIYRRLSVRMYGDEKFMRLSPLPPSGQSLWIYLLTGPHTGAIPGVFVIGKAALAEVLGWEDEAFAKAFTEVFGEGLIEFDKKSRLWFIPNAIKHNMPANPNVVRSWRSHIALLPECEMRERIFGHLRTELFALSDAFGKAFEESFEKSSAKPLPKASPKHSPKQEAGNRKQESRDSRTRSPAAERGSRLSEGWQPSLDDLQFCRAERSDLNPTEVVERFRDYWSAQPGAKGRKVNWSATWRNWVRNERAGASPTRQQATARPWEGAQ